MTALRRPLVLLLGLCCFGCRSPYFADQGAAVGAFTGALAGAAIGEEDPVAGALVGGAVGALAGTAIGDAMDQEVARSEALIEQRIGRRLLGATSVGDVITLTQAGLSPDVIVTHIEAHGVARRPQVEDLIQMQKAGVSDDVLRAMQQTPLATAAPVNPVVVEEHFYVTPPVYPIPVHHPRHHWRHGHGHGHDHGFHWGVSFGH